MRSALALLLAACPAAVVAQDTDQLRMAAQSGDAWALPEDAEHLLALQQFGECAARDSRTNSRNVLRDLPGSKTSVDALVWMVLASNSCEVHGQKPTALPIVYRGVVAEYQLERDFLLPGLEPKRGLERIFRTPEADKVGNLSPGDRTAVSVIAAGTCVAQADMPSLSALFATDPGTKEEADAINALLPALTRCLARNTRLDVHPFQLRGYLAEGAYRYGVALKEGSPDA